MLALTLRCCICSIGFMPLQTGCWERSDWAEVTPAVQSVNFPVKHPEETWLALAVASLRFSWGHLLFLCRGAAAHGIWDIMSPRWRLSVCVGAFLWTKRLKNNTGSRFPTLTTACPYYLIRFRAPCCLNFHINEKKLIFLEPIYVLRVCWHRNICKLNPLT